MKAVLKNLTADWHLIRIIRLVFGIWAGVQAIQMHEWAIGLLGVFFLYQAITNTGCCGSQGCFTPPAKTRGHDAEPIEYEEVK